MNYKNFILDIELIISMYCSWTMFIRKKPGKFIKNSNSWSSPDICGMEIIILITFSGILKYTLKYVKPDIGDLD